MSEFKVTRYKVRVKDGKKGPEQPFSAIFLSDLHNMSYGQNNEKLLQEIRNENPEVVFIAGDMLTAEKEPQMDAAIALMDELTKQYPVYYANGNHEHRMKVFPEKYGESYEKYSSRIKSYGVHLLENTHKKLEIHKMPITVWGYELPAEYFRRSSRCALTQQQMRKVLGEPEDNTFHVLLAHHPVYFETYAAWGADLTLSGHLHGGIIRLPFLGGVISPQMQIFPRYDRGLYKLDGKKLIVNAGLGDHTIKMRINNPPEMVVIDFV